MLEPNEINKIKEAAEEFFAKMTMDISSVIVDLSSEKRNINDEQNQSEEDIDVVNLDVKLNEPQILIGQGGQTLFEIQRLLKTVLNKKLQTSGDNKSFYFNLDINDYKKKKAEYLRSLAKDLADESVLTKEEKALLPMSSYERRIVHAELSKRTDVVTESRGEGFDRHIVIKPK
jgi:spoIIIJ-associated protein